MQEELVLSGVVLLTQPIGEYDKRLVILTRERGKITAFAHGVRRPHSRMIAHCQPFVFANFTLREGRDAYSLISAEGKYFFEELSSGEAVYHAFYCLELADYYGREGMEAREMVDLLFVTLRSFSKGKISPELIRHIYTARVLAMQGEFEWPEKEVLTPDAAETLRFIMSADLSRLYSFALKEELESEVFHYIDQQFRRAVDRPMKSLSLLI